jgi:uncharacterized membrane protein
VVVSGVCFFVAGAAEILGFATQAGRLTDLAALADGLVSVDPWAWASLGTLVVVATPAIGLVTTAYEYAVVSDRHTVGLALAVLAILALSGAVALLR